MADAECNPCVRINFVIVLLCVLLIVLLIGAWYIYGKYTELRVNIVEPTQQVVGIVRTNVNDLNTVLKQLKAQAAVAPITASPK